MFTVDQEKLAQVVAIVNAETDPAATAASVEEAILADWDEGDEHQAWIDSVSAQEIADWLASFYQVRPDDC